MTSDQMVTMCAHAHANGAACAASCDPANCLQTPEIPAYYSTREQQEAWLDGFVSMRGRIADAIARKPLLALFAGCRVTLAPAKAGDGFKPSRDCK